MASPGNEEELFKRSNSELKCQQSRQEANLTGHYCHFNIPNHNLFLLQIFLMQKVVLKHPSFFSMGNHDFHRKTE